MARTADAAILSALADLKAEVALLRREIAAQRPQKKAREVRLENRNALFCDLADALGGRTCLVAEAIADILDDRASPPDVMADTVRRLRRFDELPGSWRQIYRIIASEVETGAPDDALDNWLCQFVTAPQSGGTIYTDDEGA